MGVKGRAEDGEDVFCEREEVEGRRMLVLFETVVEEEGGVVKVRLGL